MKTTKSNLHMEFCRAEKKAWYQVTEDFFARKIEGSIQKDSRFACRIHNKAMDTLENESESQTVLQ